ncbi:MAG: deoxyhypusine synthase family protein [Elusimicrobia bacterium]|nr:deoxyhypusine synthase family protein [Elusimicrobiota bacterium]
MNAAITRFIDKHYRHFNAAVLKDAARAYREHLDGGGKMMVTLAGAMSTAELGISLAEMIRKDRVHIISTTGANLEEDIYNLVAHEYYERVPHYRQLSPQEEEKLLKRNLNRVTDTCIPEEEAMRRIERHMIELWGLARKEARRHFPHEFFYELIRSGRLRKSYQIDPKDSWLVAACEKNLPIVVPGWEDSTLGNMFAAFCLHRGDDHAPIMKSGVEYMMELARWYEKTVLQSPIGFFQIGGGIAGDFPICVVPMLNQDLKKNTPLWSYFCQISDSTTSYGSYSGAVPNEKITWGKLAADTPRFIIESDATIVAPLMFSYILGQ